MRDQNGDQTLRAKRPRSGKNNTCGRRARQPRNRTLERWESEREPFPAATVLSDLSPADQNPATAAAVLARFAALQLVIQTDAGVIDGGTLAMDREIAASYLTTMAIPSTREHQALASVLQLTAIDPLPALASALLAAGTAAEEREHHDGAWACYRTAYHLALSHGWEVEGAAAARAIAEIARAGGGTYSVRLWNRRAQILETRSGQRN